MNEVARVWSAEGMYLALDTSTPVGSVCVGVGSRVVARGVIHGQGSHSADLIPTIDRVLQEAGADLSELAGLVLGAGPGSFTGVRVAAATAKGLAHALDIPLWAVSSLEAGAASVDVDEIELEQAVEKPVVEKPVVEKERVMLSEEERAWPRYVLFDARSDRVYGACYRPTGTGFEVLVPPHSTTIGAVLSSDFPISVFVGDGARRHADEIRGAGFTLLSTPFGMPTAAGLLRAVAGSPSRDPVDDVARWEPEYLRSSSAERMTSSHATHASLTRSLTRGRANDLSAIPESDDGVGRTRSGPHRDDGLLHALE
ncbi:MAG: tRNA (adenosine(37)-N6)-threonylcarbamoyltransferase complex dimerization subunit type 1 TsaB [Gemmatimonadetes bacterium]|nr:tRNA (adenosine(37)-N6)-threonylcarbamoyltransferase complex dimerization subunit type 1 TsaB [Gemmatimonadota bacterium]